MSFFDRFWWLRLCAAALIAAALLLEIWFLARFRSGIRPTNAGDTFLLLAVIIGLTIIALILANSSRAARDRKRLRLAALDGNQDAVPPSRIVSDPASAPDVSHAPLIIARPPQRFDSPFLAWLGTWYLVIIVGVSTVIALAVLAASPLWSLPQGAGVPVALIQIATFILTILSGALPMSRVTIRSWRRTYGSPRRITADTDGIRWEPTLGSPRFIRWSDARLLEVDFAAYGERLYKSAEVRRRYTLYGRETVVWWFEPRGTKTHLEGEYARLLDLIAARAHLAPRTFTPGLSADHDPLPTSPPAKSAARLPEVTDTTIYALAYGGMSVPGRIIMGVIGLALTLGGVAAIARAVQAVWPLALPSAVTAITGWITLVSGACLLLPAGIIGLAMLTGSLRRQRGTLIRADANGISIEIFGSVTTHAWVDIADVRQLRFGPRDLYAMREEGHDAHSLAWPIAVPERQRREPPPGTLAVTPRELAELVAQRSGHPLLVNPPQRP